ncbi:hypothetical protein ONZ45_g3301 [Pleurotus djamor]|nr:hypothetical protein ONZ45_g3301 [Pleurotus djamor]
MLILRDPTSGGGPGVPSIAISFAVLQLVGAIGLSIILCTAICSSGVKRSSVWMSFCLAWIFSCLSYDLLFFASMQTGDDPGYGICVVQGSLVHAVPVLQAATNLSLIIHTWCFVHSTVSQKTIVMSRRASLLLLIGFPHVLSLSVFLGFLVFGLQNPSTVARDKTGVYCNIFFNRLPSKVTAEFAGMLMLVALVFEVILARQLWRHWHVLKQKSTTYITMIIRVIVFTFSGALVLGLTIVYLTAKADGSGSDFLLATRFTLCLELLEKEPSATIKTD